MIRISFFSPKHTSDRNFSFNSLLTRFNKTIQRLSSYQAIQTPTSSRFCQIIHAFNAQNKIEGERKRIPEMSLV